MNAAQIVEYAKQRGVGFVLRGDKLRAIGPAFAVNDPHFQAEVRAHKPELVALLADEPAPARAIVPFLLAGGKGGVVIDPEGMTSAVRLLIDTYGKRLDAQDLARWLEQRADIEQEALQLARATVAGTTPKGRA